MCDCGANWADYICREHRDTPEALALRPWAQKRTADTMSEAIALSSPDGSMSKRARAAAQERLRVQLFGAEGLPAPSCPQPTRAEALRQQAARLRDLAERGMKPRAFKKQAAELEAEAAALEGR